MIATPRCPHCGHLIHCAMQAGALKALLTAPGADRRPRQVYRIAGSQEWAVTYVRGRRFDKGAVDALRAAGWLAPVFPGEPSENECFGPASYYASHSYLADLAEKKRRRSRMTTKPEIEGSN